MILNLEPNWNCHHNAVWSSASLRILAGSTGTLNAKESAQNKFLRNTWNKTSINPTSKPSDPINILHPPYPYRPTSTSLELYSFIFISR